MSLPGPSTFVFDRCYGCSVFYMVDGNVMLVLDFDEITIWDWDMVNRHHPWWLWCKYCSSKSPWPHLLFCGPHRLTHPKHDSICVGSVGWSDVLLRSLLRLASVSQSVESSCPTWARPAVAALIRMLHQAVCAGRDGAVPHQFLGSKTESAASGLLFWASVSLFGKWRYLDLKSKGLFWRQI